MSRRTPGLALATAVLAALVVLVPGVAHAGPADAPSRPVQYLSTPYGTPVSGNLCAGATDPQGGPISVSTVAPMDVTFTYDTSTCAFTMTPGGYYGQLDITYKLTDGVNVSDWQRVHIAIGWPGNAPVVAGADAFAVGKELSLLVPDLSASLLANDTDPEGEVIETRNSTTPENGFLPGEAFVGANFVSDRAYLYTPPTNFVGVRRFTYLASDGVNLTQQVYTITITDKGPQKAPVGSADTYEVARNGALTMTKATGVLKNDTDADSAYVRVDGTYTKPTHGVLSDFKTYDGTWTYTPAPGFVGTDTFTYRVIDSEGNYSGYTTVTFHVTTPPPVATADSYKTAQGSTKVVDAAHGLLANDTDPDSPVLTVANVLISGIHGTFVVDNATGGFTWTPTPGWSGTDTIIYRAQDEMGNPSAWTNITLTAVAPGDNQVPDATADSYQVRQGTPLTPAAGMRLLANDTDFEGSDLDVASHTAPAHGALTAFDDETGAFTYTGTPGWHGTDSFTYVAKDAQGKLSAPATVTITVFNDRPLTAGDAYVAVPGVPLTVPAASGLLANDDDLEGEQIEVATTWSPLHGTISLADDGSFVYTSEADFEGVESFDYTVKDASGQESEPATVTITVQTGTLLTPAPTLTGTARVGQVLTAQPGDWGAPAVSFAHQWLRDGAPIAGATLPSYRLTAADLGRAVSVRVRGTKAGYAGGETTSPARTVARGLLVAPRPRISGTPAAGRTLRAIAGTWGPGTVTKTYRWYRNGVAIKGASRASYRLTRADRGKRITVRLTGRKVAHVTAVRTSGAVRVR